MLEIILKTRDHNKYNLKLKTDYGQWQCSNVNLELAYLLKLVYNMKNRDYYDGGNYDAGSYFDIN